MCRQSQGCLIHKNFNTERAHLSGNNGSCSLNLNINLLEYNIDAASSTVLVSAPIQKVCEIRALFQCPRVQKIKLIYTDRT